MNSFVRSLAAVAFSGLLGIGYTGLVQAQPLTRHSGAPALMLAGNLPNSSYDTNPNNSAVRRANPNSRQGTDTGSSPIRGPGTQPNVRPPTLENGGIGNGYPTRQQPSRPSSGTSNDRGTRN